MALDDLRYEPTGGPAPEPPPRPGPLRWIAVALAGVAAGGLLTFWWMSRAQPPATSPAATTAAADTGSPRNRPAPQPMPLPPLSASDSFLRDLVSTLSRHPALARWLATDDLVRGAALAVVQIGDGRTPAVPLGALQPASRVAVAGTEAGAVDPASYRRWDPAVSALTSIEPADAAQVYVNVKPLLDEAYEELGYPDGNFDDAVARAVRMLAETPDVSEPPLLLRRPAYFEYEDAALRSLRPVQKQFVLIGPDNRRQVMAWLRRLAAALDLAG
jgi:hypothetical protein